MIQHPARPAALPFTRADIEQSVPARFEQIVERFADCVAVVGNGERLTYRALNGRANAIAEAIAARTAPGPGCVAFLVDHSPEMVACVLGVLKAGKIQLAIHPGMPGPAQHEIVRDAAPELILASAAHLSRAGEIAGAGTCPVVNLDDVDRLRSVDNPPIATGPDDLSTIFYTSGTTGQPKGVMKNHRALMHRMWLAGVHDEVVPTDRQSLLTSCSFSASEADLFGALLYGATLCLFDVASLGLDAFREWIDKEQITLLHPPALLFRRFLATLEGVNLFPSVRLVCLAGDVVLPADIEKWMLHFSRDCTLIHRFSTTETALLAVERIAHDGPLPTAFVAAGRPVADKDLVLLDPDGRPVEKGATGELVVKSRYIADGYWRRPEESAAAFRPDPDCPGGRIYRTGDLGRFLDDGTFVFAGRRDHQVKIRGYRVETREIEAALLRFDDVREAAVLVHHDGDDPRLTAFVVLKPGGTWDGAALRDRLRAVLPEWKVPNQFRRIAVLPTTLTGKIDRRQLLDRFHSEEPRVAPRTPIECRLAGIWGAILGVDDVGVHNNFFELGGHSLQAMRVVSQIRRDLAIDLPLRALFENPTIEKLALCLLELQIRPTRPERVASLLDELQALSDENALGQPGLGSAPIDGGE